MSDTTYTWRSQTSNALALALGAPPSAAIAQTVANHLADDVQGFANGNQTTTGVAGIAWLLPQLERYGHGEVGAHSTHRTVAITIADHNSIHVLCTRHVYRT